MTVAQDVRTRISELNTSLATNRNNQTAKAKALDTANRSPRKWAEVKTAILAVKAERDDRVRKLIAGLAGISSDEWIAPHLDVIVDALEAMTPMVDYEARLDDLASLYPASVRSAANPTQLAADIETLKTEEAAILRELRELGANV